MKDRLWLWPNEARRSSKLGSVLEVGAKMFVMFFYTGYWAPKIARYSLLTWRTGTRGSGKGRWIFGQITD